MSEKKSDNIKFYELLSDKITKVQNEKEFQTFIEWNFKSTKQNIQKLQYQIEKNQKSFYSYAAVIWEEQIADSFKVHFPDIKPDLIKKIKRNQEIYTLPQYLNFLNTLTDNADEDELDEYFNELASCESVDKLNSALLPVFLSPLAINYFHNSFNEIMTPYFTEQQHTPLDDQAINNLIGSLVTSLQQNLCYCPSYLIKLLSKADIFSNFNLSNSSIFRKFALDILFLCPNLYEIESTLNNAQLIHNELNNFLDNLAETFMYILPYSEGFSLLQPIEDDTAFKQSSMISNDKDSFPFYFRQLLKISPKLPDELPPDLAGKPCNEIIQELVVRPGPQFFKRYKLFARMEDIINNENLNSNSSRLRLHYMNALRNMQFTHESEKIAELSNHNTRLSHIQYITSKVVSTYREMILHLLRRDELKHQDSRIYINSPQTFIDDIKRIQPTLIKKQDKLKDIFDADNIYNNLIKDINFNDFIRLRKDILTADRSLDTILQNYKYRKLSLSTLKDFQKQDKRGFDELRNNFVAAFSEFTDPLTKAKRISQAYSEIARKVKSKLGVDAANMEEGDWNTFIFSIFCLMNPTKVISVYVYLMEFVFHSKYNEILEKAPYKNEIDLSKYILRTLINYCSKLDVFEGINDSCPNFIYQCTSLSHICREKAEIKVRYEDREKLAIISDPEYFTGDKIYEEAKQAPGAKSLINYFKQTDPRRHISLIVFDNVERIYVCDIVYVLNDEVKELPTDKLELIEYIKQQNK